MPCKQNHEHALWPTSGVHFLVIEPCETHCGWCDYETAHANNLRVHARRHLANFKDETLQGVTIAKLKAGRKRVQMTKGRLERLLNEDALVASLPRLETLKRRQDELEGASSPAVKEIEGDSAVKKKRKLSHAAVGAVRKVSGIENRPRLPVTCRAEEYTASHLYQPEEEEEFGFRSPLDEVTRNEFGTRSTFSPALAEQIHRSPESLSLDVLLATGSEIVGIHGRQSSEIATTSSLSQLTARNDSISSANHRELIEYVFGDDSEGELRESLPKNNSYLTLTSPIVQVCLSQEPQDPSPFPDSKQSLRICGDFIDNIHFYLSIILDPRFKTQWFRENVNEPEKVIEQIRQYLKDTNPPALGREFLGYCDVDLYIDSPPEVWKSKSTSSADLMEGMMIWWKAHKVTFPTMAEAVRRVYMFEL